MHLAPGDRDRGIRKLAGLLRLGGILVISFRTTPFDDERTFHPTNAEQLRAQARAQMLEVVRQAESGDSLGRQGITWTTLVFRLPDDGTGALPLLRHVIINDAKSSTYKLALLRCLLRVADSYAGTAEVNADGSVRVPLGLVALSCIEPSRSGSGRGIREAVEDGVECPRGATLFLKFSPGDPILCLIDWDWLPPRPPAPFAPTNADT